MSLKGQRSLAGVNNLFEPNVKFFKQVSIMSHKKKKGPGHEKFQDGGHFPRWLPDDHIIMRYLPSLC